MPPAAFIFGTVGSPLSTPPKPGGTVGGIARTAELGLGALELAWVRSVRVTEAQMRRDQGRRPRTRRGALGARALFHQSERHEEEWPKSRKRLMDSAHYGHLAGATDIVFHPGSYFGRPSAEVLEVAVPRLRACVAELRDHDNPVTLRPETMGKVALLGTLEDALDMAAEVEGVLPCIDFAHLHARAGRRRDEFVRRMDGHAEASSRSAGGGRAQASSHPPLRHRIYRQGREAAFGSQRVRPEVQRAVPGPARWRLRGPPDVREPGHGGRRAE